MYFISTLYSSVHWHDTPYFCLIQMKEKVTRIIMIYWFIRNLFSVLKWLYCSSINRCHQWIVSSIILLRVFNASILHIYCQLNKIYDASGDFMQHKLSKNTVTSSEIYICICIYYICVIDHWIYLDTVLNWPAEFVQYMYLYWPSFDSSRWC